MESFLNALVSIAVGLAVLLYGRRINWFAAATGVLIGLNLMRSLFPDATPLSTLIVAVALGVGGYLLGSTGSAMVQLVFRIMGAIAGAAIALWLFRSLGLDNGVLVWVGLVGGGLIGFLLIQHFLNWASSC